MMYGVGVGMRLIRISVGVWGTPAFWDTIGWWHNEVHYTIPRLKEEKRVAAELELAFGVGAVTSIPYGVTSFAINNITPNISLGEGSLTFKDQRVIIDPCKSSIGEWQWESVGFRTGKVPTPLRRLLVRVLVGAEWVGDKSSKALVPLAPEYSRLQEFIDSLQS